MNPNYIPEYGILLDMVGDKNLRIPKEAYSVSRVKIVVYKIWNVASNVGANAVIDDHIAFLKKLIPVVDLIRLPFPKPGIQQMINQNIAVVQVYNKLAMFWLKLFTMKNKYTPYNMWLNATA